MKELALVFIGGGLGSVVRFVIARWVNQLHITPFPYGTFAVNVVACFVLGFMIGLADHRQLISPTARLFWTIGFCGGFSTFSAFSNETLGLIQNQEIFLAGVYIVSSMSVCLVMVYLGLSVGQRL